MSEPKTLCICEITHQIINQNKDTMIFINLSSCIYLHNGNTFYISHNIRCPNCMCYNRYCILLKDNRYWCVKDGQIRQIETYPCEYKGKLTLSVDAKFNPISWLGNTIENLLPSVHDNGLIYFDDCSIIDRFGFTFNLSDGRIVGCFNDINNKTVIIDSYGKIVPHEYLSFRFCCMSYSNDKMKVSIDYNREDGYYNTIAEKRECCKKRM